MLQLNGKQVEWDRDSGTIQDLLASYHLEHKIVVVERNKEIIGKEQYHEVVLCDRDVIEIVHFVGGG
ncbi:sulfur carrier protein ThiS [Bacillus mojavensis]|uniref:sulfur carrier protein ThiS n=1 Tax=Bacillus mojavensis TaxID=72360 RepID=UPI002DBFFE17|nr:sulfur carrier protein ThiS [Bacillus mojavensis]MEC1289027.1 sulfur carrier protein ThiS [Bacillus mojavensis]MEC1613415.1 sulfur carrier protein ThiS [Bacillus mojavensis]MEC1621164.1 sulfur carrier protein ThiS [Bacillus mojavensis]MEC1635604.1 sulfur carrier protein ThiS [Bacillus mojavensis]MEC1660964.1 sulfur carrier protein ThiS [Bacillus mojavensis]